VFKKIPPVVVVDGHQQPPELVDQEEVVVVVRCPLLVEVQEILQKKYQDKDTMAAPQLQVAAVEEVLAA
jgi:hypothetical protein